MKKHILVLGTGGTIAGAAASSTNTLSYQAGVLSIEQILAEIPSLQDIADVSARQIAQVDSSDMTHAIWLALSEEINAALQQDAVDGIVVTHGTDTLEETAYFLNLTIHSRKPVVLVGAMRPATAMSTDGPMNLYDAVVLAASDEAVGQGVLVSLNDTINSSRDVTKTSTSLQDTFKSPELGYLGYILGGQPYFYRYPTRRHTADSIFQADRSTRLPQTEILYAYVGAGRQLIDAAVASGAQGIVYAGLGNGGIPAPILEALADAQRQGIVIARSSRASSGIVTRNGALDDDAHGFVAADNLNPQKARILLMLALTQTSDPTVIQRYFREY